MSALDRAIEATERALRALKAVRDDKSDGSKYWTPSSKKRAAAKLATLDAQFATADWRLGREDDVK